jgi:hypothetical protein
MRMHRILHASFAISFALTSAGVAALAACASQSPDASTASSPGSAPGSLSVAAVSTPALDVLKRGGSFAFALEESSPASVIREQCTKQSGGDVAKANACYARVSDVASREGIRFAMDPSGHLVWTSYGAEDGKEEIYIEAPLSVVTEGDRVVVGTPAGPAHGIQLEGKQFPAGKQIRFEVVDVATVTMSDPEKGTLVFHRTH